MSSRSSPVASREAHHEKKASREACFIDGARGPLFSVHHRPAAGAVARGECFVIVPAFAEEMNRCRYMTTMFAQAASADGFGCLNVDPFGTGDSSGEFVEADWAGWGEDMVCAVAHARSLGYERVSLLCIRLGALLAMSVIDRLGPLGRLLLWQPVTSGKSTLTQFLRIRIAAAMERDEAGGTVAGYREQSAAGEVVQVAGYDVSPGLFAGIDGAALSDSIGFADAALTWFTTLASEGRKTPRAELKLIEQWQAAGAELSHVEAPGPAYWAVHERTLAPALVDATLDVVNGRTPPPMPAPKPLSAATAAAPAILGSSSDGGA